MNKFRATCQKPSMALPRNNEEHKDIAMGKRAKISDGQIQICPNRRPKTVGCV
jgi:hypothetical protein